MNVIGGKDKLDSIKDLIRNKTRSLQPAKQWMEKAKERYTS
jgi:hypothetical protein